MCAQIQSQKSADEGVPFCTILEQLLRGSHRLPERTPSSSPPFVPLFQVSSPPLSLLLTLPASRCALSRASFSSSFLRFPLGLLGFLLLLVFVEGLQADVPARANAGAALLVLGAVPIGGAAGLLLGAAGQQLDGAARLGLRGEGDRVGGEGEGGMGIKIRVVGLPIDFFSIDLYICLCICLQIISYYYILHYFLFLGYVHFFEI